MHTLIDMTASIIQSAHAYGTSVSAHSVPTVAWSWVGLTKWAHPSPKAGTHTKTTMFTIVARPIGNYPINMLCAGCLIIFNQISGQRTYLKIEMPRKRMNSRPFRQKIATEIQYSQRPL